MAGNTPPKHVKHIMITIQARGYRAFLVGGCVRDMILDVQPQDWDICTSALPEQVMEIFPDSRPTGLKHGTVTVTENAKSVEVTTFRSEGSYADHRHPDSVSFVGDLTTDLSRRDFTMNAIAVSTDGLVADPFGGIDDIKNKLIRCVGEPELRFEEDALRMFRAFRFSARLGFEVEPVTRAAIIKKAPLASALAAERVRDEIEKILLTARPEGLFELIDAGLLDKYLLCRLGEDRFLRRISRLPKKALPRWAAFCRILEQGRCIRSTEDFLLMLKLDSRTVRCCADCSQILGQEPPESSVAWKRLLCRKGVDTVTCAAQCRDALYGGECHKALKAVLKSGECFSMKHLAVTGDDLLALGIHGRQLGEMLNFLLDYVMEYPENNRRELLLSLAKCSEES